MAQEFLFNIPANTPPSTTTAADAEAALEKVHSEQLGYGAEESSDLSVWIVSWGVQGTSHYQRLFEDWQDAKDFFDTLYPKYKQKWEEFPHLPSHLSDVIATYDSLAHGDEFHYPVICSIDNKLDMRLKPVKRKGGHATKGA